MKYVLGRKQFVGFGTSIGGVVTKAFQLGRGNAVQISLVVREIAHLGNPSLILGLQFSNTQQNWTTDSVNIITALGVGHYTILVPTVVGAWARVAYFTNNETAAIVAVDVNISVQ
jgi:hypothetical protein